jgi:hypothetical protein
VADLPAISSSFQGGYYAGLISHTANGVETHALIISPKAVGSALNGWANGEAMNNASHLAAEFCRSLNIGGYDDWYLPATPVLTSGAGMEAGVAERAGALLVLAAGDAHQPHAIAQVVLQGTGDAAAQIGPSGLASSAAWSGADQGLAGHLDQILPLHQREQAPGHDGGNGIGKGQVLHHQGITGRQDRATEGGSGGSHRQDGEEPHAHRPAAARRGKDAPQGRMARSLTRREGWPRGAVGVRRSWWRSRPPTLIRQHVGDPSRQKARPSVTRSSDSMRPAHSFPCSHEE